MDFWFDFRVEPILATSKNYSSKVVKSDSKNNYLTFSLMFTLKPDALDLQEKKFSCTNTNNNNNNNNNIVINCVSPVLKYPSLESVEQSLQNSKTYF